MHCVLRCEVQSVAIVFVPALMMMPKTRIVAGAAALDDARAALAAFVWLHSQIASIQKSAIASAPTSLLPFEIYPCPVHLARLQARAALASACPHLPTPKFLHMVFKKHEQLPSKRSSAPGSRKPSSSCSIHYSRSRTYRMQYIRLRFFGFEKLPS